MIIRAKKHFFQSILNGSMQILGDRKIQFPDRADLMEETHRCSSVVLYLDPVMGCRTSTP
jgi:hypothetical protein